MGNVCHSKSLPGTPNFWNHGPEVTYKQIFKKRPDHGQSPPDPITTVSNRHHIHYPISTISNQHHSQSAPHSITTTSNRHHIQYRTTPHSSFLSLRVSFSSFAVDGKSSGDGERAAKSGKESGSGLTGRWRRLQPAFRTTGGEEKSKA